MKTYKLRQGLVPCVMTDTTLYSHFKRTKPFEWDDAARRAYETNECRIGEPHYNGLDLMSWGLASGNVYWIVHWMTIHPERWSVP